MDIKGEERVETAVRVIVESLQVEALKDLNFRPFCGETRAHVVIIKEKKEEICGTREMVVEPASVKAGKAKEEEGEAVPDA